MKIRKASLHASVNNSYRIKIPDASDAKFLKNGKDYKPESISGTIARVDLRKDDILDIVY
jgi:hypothetical protein